MGWLKWYFQ